MSWFKEDGLRHDIDGNILRSDQEIAPSLEVGDRFFDIQIERWATVINIRPHAVAMGAPFESLYDATYDCAAFIGTAMHADIGKVIKGERINA